MAQQTPIHINDHHRDVGNGKGGKIRGIVSRQSPLQPNPVEQIPVQYAKGKGHAARRLRFDETEVDENGILLFPYTLEPYWDDREQAHVKHLDENENTGSCHARCMQCEVVFLSDGCSEITCPGCWDNLCPDCRMEGIECECQASLHFPCVPYVPSANYFPPRMAALCYISNAKRMLDHGKCPRNMLICRRSPTSCTSSSRGRLLT